MIKFNFDSSVIVIPTSVVELMNKASKKDVQFLLSLAAMRIDGRELSEIIACAPQKKVRKSADGTLPPPITERQALVNALSALLGFKSAEVGAALDFWESAGVISLGNEVKSNAAAPAPEVQRAPLRPSGEPARYSAADIAAILELRAEIPTLIDEAQKALGKVFSSHEVSIIVSMMDYLGIDAEFIILVMNYCRKIGHPTVRYAEKVAYDMYDKGIYTAAELEKRLATDEKLAGFERKIRNLFGLNDRSLTTKELNFIESWTSVMKYDISVIKKAYEVTINAISSPSIPYTNAILEKWNSLGLHTLDEIERELESRKKTTAVSLGNSFDTDEFFNAALRRSLGE